MSDRWCQECGCVEYECHCDYPVLGAGDEDQEVVTAADWLHQSDGPPEDDDLLSSDEQEGRSDG